MPEIWYAAGSGFNPRRELPKTCGTGRASLVPLTSWATASQQLSEACPCAVLVSMDYMLLEQHDYVQFVLACAERASNTPTFRLYIYLHDMTLKDLDDRSKTEMPLADIRDTINIPTDEQGEAIRQIDESLAEFVNSLADIRDASRFRRGMLCLFTPIVFLSVALVVWSLLSLGIAIALAWSLEHGGKAPASNLADAISLGLGVFLVTGILLALAHRRLRLALLGSVAAGIWAEVVLRLSMPGIVVGIMLGFATHYIRQRWILLRPIRLSFTGEIAADDWMGASCVRQLLRFFGSDLYPRKRQVFISYARRTWADEMVRRLRRRLRERKVECFLDIQDIEIGACWRHALEDGIRRCTLFLFFDQGQVDQLPRLWHRAELHTAGLMNSRCGLPSIVIVAQDVGKPEALARYRRRLRHIAGKANFHTVPLGEDEVEQFADIVADFPVKPASGAGDPKWDTLFVIPVLTVLNAAMAGLMAVANLSFYLLLPIWLCLVQIGPRGLEVRQLIPLEVSAAWAFLCVGFGTRSLLHLSYEALYAPTRRHRPATAVLLTVYIATGLTLLFNATKWGLTLSAGALLLGFVVLDHMVAMSREGFSFGMRRTLDRM